jgi:hypothetical protein
MKLFTKIIIGILLIAAIAGYWYWQENKKHIVKDSIDSLLKKKTDSLYFIHYDSSKIDEATESASFYNVSLQSDSLQKEYLKSTDSLPDNLYNIHIDEIKITTVNIPALLSNEKVSATKIFLNRPVVQIINTGSDKPKPFSYKDTLELYKRILGKFKSIQADTIQISNGTLVMIDKNGKPLSTLEKINVRLNKFLIDSLHDYKNIESYFVKDVVVTIENIQLPESDNGTRINIDTLVYDAPKRLLHISTIQQYKTGNTQPLINLKNINITSLNTDAFIGYQQLKAGNVICDGGVITIYKNSKSHKDADKKDQAINFSSNLISEIAVDGMRLSNTKIIIIDTTKINEKPLVLNDVKFIVTKVNNVTDGTEIRDIINNAAWQLSVGNFSIPTKDKLYTMIATGVQLNNIKTSVEIKSIKVQPELKKEEFSRKIIHQHDRYDLLFNNIVLKGVNFQHLINDKVLEVDNASLQPVLKIFNDRTVPPDTASKVGKYPNQQLSMLPFQLYIKKLTINNGYVAYTEKAKKSELEGTVFFSNINATISNITNIKEKINKNKKLTLNATALFLGAGPLSTKWLLPLSKTDTNFIVTGNLGKMKATALNSLVEPLAMVSVKNGDIQQLDFNLLGSDHRTTGAVDFLYNDLDIKVLKKDGDDLKKNDIQTFLANTLLKNSNPQSGETRTGKVDYMRDINKSFFNLLWKSIFSGVKKIALK